MTDGALREQFNDMMFRHAAPFNEILARYVRRMPKVDREWFTERALEVAWERHSECDPVKKSLLIWWEDCLREVARMRPTWRLYGPQGWSEVKGRRLGR